MHPELDRYIKDKNWIWKRLDGDNIGIRVCPFCGHENYKFSIHEKTALFKCWHCSESGNLYSLKRSLGDINKLVSAAQITDTDKPKKSNPIDMKFIDKFHNQLLKFKRGRDYLTQRCFSEETIRYFKLGVKKSNGDFWIVIPHINDGICHNIKFRSLPPAEKKFTRNKGSESVLFNADALAEYDEIIIAEAELDAISFWEAGIKNVVGLTCGADSFQPEWLDALADKTKIILCLDADSVGQISARKIARRLGFDRCYNVMLPCNDANQVLQEYGAAALNESIKDQEQFEVHGVISGADVISRCMMSDDIGEVGYFTPWEGVNRLLGKGQQLGNLVVLSGRVKTGKTTLALNEGVFLASLGIPSLTFCLEMTVEQLGRKVVASMCRKNIDKLDQLDYLDVRSRMESMPFYFVEPDWGSSFKVANVMDKIRESVKRYGIKHLVFDNLHFLCRSLQYITAEIGQVTRTFKKLAQELDILIWLVAQPKKIGSDRPMQHEDLKDSSSIAADADKIILLHRDRIPTNMESEEGQDNVFSPKTLCRIDADRGQGGGSAWLYYEGASSLFTDWDQRPITTR